MVYPSLACANRTPYRRVVEMLVALDLPQKRALIPIAGRINRGSPAKRSWIHFLIMQHREMYPIPLAKRFGGSTGRGFARLKHRLPV
jgi:hypothetical protein